MKKPSLTDVIIELHVPDFKKAEDFYSKLGFEAVWQSSKEDDGYLVMKRKDSILAFFGGNEKVCGHQFFKKFSKDTPRGYGVEIAIYISDMNIETYYADVISKIGEEYVVQPLEKKPWGTRDFRIEDSFGFYLCIRESDNILVE